MLGRTLTMWSFPAPLPGWCGHSQACERRLSRDGRTMGWAGYMRLIGRWTHWTLHCFWPPAGAYGRSATCSYLKGSSPRCTRWWRSLRDNSLILRSGPCMNLAKGVFPYCISLV
ncbi:hypothetical protein Salat_0877100 [Sesamum alatum]|uniref:Uncharacterized protein n=1 Tax=Sesamum alatum TaxID=300844 RepID=A0AAE2CQU4_9LAMI|nr:hypothetical protein Salat_0877100 [Sesamum alatum]